MSRRATAPTLLAFTALAGPALANDLPRSACQGGIARSKSPAASWRRQRWIDARRAAVIRSGDRWL
jgi:hypothetical protein